MKLTIITVAALFASSQLADAQSIAGTWAETREQCILHGEDNPPITVTKDSVEYYETACDLKNPTNLRDMNEGKLYDMECWSEGTMATSRAFIATNGLEGLIIYRDGFASVYARCR